MDFLTDEGRVQLDSDKLVTVQLTVAQWIALTDLADLGVDEKRYDIHENHPYEPDEEEAALAACNSVVSSIQTIADIIITEGAI